MIDEAIIELTPVVGTAAGCSAVGRPRSTHYRWHRQSLPPPKPERVATPQPRALSEIERKEVLRVLHEPDHVDEAPATVYAKLLDEGLYVASVPTMYRILRAAGEVRERRRQGTHPAHKKPELVATAPNEVWSWDITKLLGPVKWTYYYLYVIIDIYSRYVPGWMLARAEDNRPAPVNHFGTDFFVNHCVVVASSGGSLIQATSGSCGGFGGLRTNRSGCAA